MIASIVALQGSGAVPAGTVWPGFLDGTCFSGFPEKGNKSGTDAGCSTTKVKSETPHIP